MSKKACILTTLLMLAACKESPGKSAALEPGDAPFPATPSQFTGPVPTITQTYPQVSIMPVEPPALKTGSEQTKMSGPPGPLADTAFWERTHVDRKMATDQSSTLTLQELAEPDGDTTHWGTVVWKQEPRIVGHGRFRRVAGTWRPEGTFVFEHAVEQGAQSSQYLRCSIPFQAGKLTGMLVCDMGHGRQLQEIAGANTLETRLFLGGHIRSLKNFRHGSNHGLHATWHQSGALRSVARYEEGQLQGCSQRYGQEGHIESRVCTDALGTTRSIIEYPPRGDLSVATFQEERDEIGETTLIRGHKRSVH